MGLLVKDESAGRLVPAPNIDSKEVMYVGDVKTCDLLDKGRSNLRLHPASARDTAIQADDLLKVLDKIGIKAGDWHASMAMLQAGNNVF